jgi:PLP dependent protein
LKPHLQAMNGNPSLARRYEAVKTRIERAALAAGRDPGSVRLLAVGKTFPAAAVAELAALGQEAFGENYLQEALAKMAALAHLRPGPAALPGSIEWHFIGPIQSNKTRRIAESFDWVQSVDQERIARRLSEQRPPELPPLQVCLQVNVSGEASKSGCEPDDVVPLAQAMAAMPGIRLRGLMAIPEPTDDPRLQASRFGQLRGLLDDVRQALEAAALPGADQLDTLSMGMSADLEAAIAAGATIVRVGSALFGERPPKD